MQVDGSSVHQGLETFLGDIETNVIYPATPGGTVTIPGSGASSTVIGPGGTC